MDMLWLLKGDHDAPGWKLLEQDSKAEKVDLVLFDRDAWAIVKAAQSPTQYEGLVPKEPPDGMYVSQQGYPVYVVGCQEVRGPYEVIAALGEQAVAMLEELEDPTVVLERLGRAF